MLLRTGEVSAKFDYLIHEIQVKHTIIFIYTIKFKPHALRHLYKKEKKKKDKYYFDCT